MAIKVRKGHHNPSSLHVMNFIHFIRYTFVHCMSLSEFPKCVRAISKIEFEINTSNVTKQGIMFLSYKYTDTSIHIDISFPFVNKAETNYYNQILLQKNISKTCCEIRFIKTATAWIHYFLDFLFEFHKMTKERRIWLIILHLLSFTIKTFTSFTFNTKFPYRTCTK